MTSHVLNEMEGGGEGAKESEGCRSAEEARGNLVALFGQRQRQREREREKERERESGSKVNRTESGEGIAKGGGSIARP